MHPGVTWPQQVYRLITRGHVSYAMGIARLSCAISTKRRRRIEVDICLYTSSRRLAVSWNSRTGWTVRYDGRLNTPLRWGFLPLVGIFYRKLYELPCLGGKEYQN